ncbi:MAG: TerD family protein [Cytophagales bacterium]|nr:MAG: TerD family protein [Cytophagales bacterium]TAF59949.1 MAG: TerD family protein [Cytophagales bacterium]
MSIYHKHIADKLEKGAAYKLIDKDTEDAITSVTIGLNWGIIKKTAFFGLIRNKEAVDLDGSVAVFDKNRNLIDQVYYKKLESYDGAIKHGGDDLSGDLNGNDGTDNETVALDFVKISPNVHQVVFFLNSFKGQDFSQIPYATISIYKGTGDKVDKQLLTSFSISADDAFEGKVSVVMAKFYREGRDWIFQSIGEAVDSKRIPGTIEAIQQRYL